MKQQISALMDGEQIDDELATNMNGSTGLDPVITAIKAGGKSAETWATYHLIGDVMRGHPVFKQDFQQRLMQKLEKEATILAPYPHKKTALKHEAIPEQPKETWVKIPSKWSIAASLTAVAFVGWVAVQQQSQNNLNTTTNTVVQNESTQKVPAEYLIAHQFSAPGNAAYYIQPASYSESAH